MRDSGRTEHEWHAREQEAVASGLTETNERGERSRDKEIYEEGV